MLYFSGEAGTMSGEELEELKQYGLEVVINKEN